ncbi:MAG: hypothetical protein LBC92_03850 [Rickettsiales bacterium]|jgi:hypothetical protein|nr:hypothetical protein [Rickettsiales bacterium]
MERKKERKREESKREKVNLSSLIFLIMINEKQGVFFMPDVILRLNDEELTLIKHYLVAYNETYKKQASQNSFIKGLIMDSLLVNKNEKDLHRIEDKINDMVMMIYTIASEVLSKENLKDMVDRLKGTEDDDASSDEDNEDEDDYFTIKLKEEEEDRILDEEAESLFKVHDKESMLKRYDELRNEVNGFNGNSGKNSASNDSKNNKRN